LGALAKGYNTFGRGMGVVDAARGAASAAANGDVLGFLRGLGGAVARANLCGMGTLAKGAINPFKNSTILGVIPFYFPLVFWCSSYALLMASGHENVGAFEGS
jgi:hypothetical protein